MKFTETTSYLFGSYPRAASSAELVSLERDIAIACEELIAHVLAGTIAVQDAMHRCDALCEVGAIASADWLALYPY